MASSSKYTQPDSFMDEEDLACPLCIEEFDLADRGFRPCPCGYQICQFCYNNIKNNMNGLCPACRRPYNDETVEWKVVTQEEIAAFKLAAQRNAKKKAEQRKKEAQTREAESQNRKHLAGLRVVQKNLVYVVGLSPGIPEADLLKTLRGDKYFGQYGPIVKIVVSKGKHGETPSSNGSLGVYVTFASAHDAEKCIKAVNNSTNGDRVLRAQLGTTKYCSAYLRNEVCTNKSCMFLHEPGDNDDSYSRQDLSTINSVNTQRPLQYGTSSLSSTVHAARQEAHAQAPIAQAQPVAAATQPMTCTMSTHGSDGGAGPALPTTANWAKSGQQQSSRRHSAATSVASSPAVSTSLPAPAPSEGNGSEDNESDDGQASSVAETTPVPKTPKPPVDPILDQVLSAISRLSTFKASKKESQVTYLPLWDDQGGLKRRRMREAMQQEQEDAAARQQAELERQQEAAAAEATSTPDVVEEQEPASGSGQLGGEPEDVDRDGAHSAGFLDQRCPSTQMPIQRGSQDSAVFGATGAFSPNAVASINGRSLTPMQQQQLLLLKGSQPQSGFADQYPPGMGGLPGPSRLFQQQGHARQLSRYDFSSGAGPSSTPKPGPSSKMLGQQAMGLPSNQFYASAMPGPPPGLKSTGTPPNGMFGQTQFGGAAFGNKENSSDVLRNILSTRAGIGAGGAGVGPGHEAGKQDNLLSMDADVSQSVDALVADSVSDAAASPYNHDYALPPRAATPSVPPGFGLPHAHPSPTIREEPPISRPVSRIPSRPAPNQHTPPRNIASLVSTHVPRVATPLSTVSVPPSPTPVPAVAVKPSVSKKAQEKAQKEAQKETQKAAQEKEKAEKKEKEAEAKAAKEAEVKAAKEAKEAEEADEKAKAKEKSQEKEQAKDHVKSLAANSGLSKTIASQAAQMIETPVLENEDFPSLAKAAAAEKAKAEKASTPTGPRAMGMKKTAAAPTSAAPVASGPGPAPAKPATTKKSTPGILNITVPAPPATKPVTEKEEPTKTPITKPAIDASAFPALPPSAPPTAAITTSAKGPKTLRLISTPRAESPCSTTPPLSAVLSHAPAFPGTRQASIVSSTPASDVISDTASHASASISRAGSPPPSRIGSAPVRTTTKSQLKKARKEAMREKLEVEVAVEPEVEEIGPIMGRKKKQKKSKESKPTPVPAAGRPQTAKGPEKAETESRKVSTGFDISNKPQESGSITAAKPEDTKGKGNAKAKVEEITVLEPPAPTVEPVDENAGKPIPSPSTVFRELRSDGAIPEPDALAVFRAPPGINYRMDYRSDVPHEQESKLVITEEDRADLLAGKPVRKIMPGGSRIMLTPNGDCVRNLTAEEEDRYLQLQQRVYEESGPTAFVPARHTATQGFTLIGGRAVPNGPPSFFPPVDGGNAVHPMDPVQKIQRDEALSYINQYVLPSLSTNSQLERALNANALDAEMLRPSDPQSWASWGGCHNNSGNADNRNGQEMPYGGSRPDGILASGLESMTAHFAVGRENGRSQPLGNVTLLSLAESETSLQAARRETENLEKKLNQLLKRNKRMFLGAGH